MTKPLPELTLIVAATQHMGIGRGGTLPWTGLRKEMAYFARPAPTTHPSTPQNAVVMGRKTWDSIPPRFQPLASRLNVVVSRTLPREGREDGTGRVVVHSLEEAIRVLTSSITPTSTSASPSTAASSASSTKDTRIFVIGGAQIYRASLALREARRVLLTRVLTEFECDTFFPIRLDEGPEGDKEWKRVGQEEMDRWVGEVVPRGVQVEGGTEYRFEMWERVDERVE
ncbi:dihydrofolate reductase-like domain-containing protein [Chaetomium sp. MPI-SDFR-AT-0129]|nr:dihydrofolate reductase-like domain-containing protein [Chaetomium sp. MPI-SDFR-AT-0129]